MLRVRKSAKLQGPCSASSARRLVTVVSFAFSAVLVPEAFSHASARESQLIGSDAPHETTGTAGEISGATKTRTRIGIDQHVVDGPLCPDCAFVHQKSAAGSRQAGALSISPDFASRVCTVVTDMDGTFFGPKLAVSPSTVAAYRRCVDAGIAVIPATGRLYEGVKEALERAGVAEDVQLFPGVYINGCVAFGPGGKDDIVYEQCMKPEAVELVEKFTQRVNSEWMARDPERWDEHPLIRDAPREHGFHAVVNDKLKPSVASLIAYIPGGWVYHEDDQLTDGMRQWGEPCLGSVKMPLSEYAKTNKVYKLILLTHGGELMAQLRPQLHELLAGRDVSASVAIPRMLEFMPSAANKAIALRAILDRLGHSSDAVVALGDGENDVEMLRSFALSIAMDNASAHVKEQAHVTTSSNAEDGWALAVNALVELKEKAAAQRRGRCTEHLGEEHPAPQIIEAVA